MEHAFMRLVVAAACGNLVVECAHLLVSHEPRVAFLMAGSYGHQMGLDHQRYAAAFFDHMIGPLLPQFRVALIIASEPGESSAWEKWCHGFHDVIIVGIREGAPLPEINTTRFSRDRCVHKDCYKYWLQYGHLRNSYEQMKLYESEHSVHFDYLVKARQDVEYKPDNFISPGWFSKMAADEIAVPSTEFHMTDRWMERKPSWPDGMSDQLVLGPRLAMDYYFDLFWSRPTKTPRRRYGIENMLAEHMVSGSVKVRTVELQLSQPGGKFWNGNDRHGGWVTTPCELCMVA
jgi:hypothetical protein